MTHIHRAVLVLGMLRSGTSCLAAMLSRAGVDAPGATVRNWDNRRGHHEATALVRLNEGVLAHSGGHWLKPPAAVRWTEAQAGERDRLLDDATTLLKDPRCLLTLPFWIAGGPLRAVGIVRHPLAAARSLWAWRGLPIADGVALWTAHNRALLTAHRDLGVPLIDFDRSRDSTIDATVSVARELGLALDPREAATAYAEDLVHHHGGPCDAAAAALHQQLQAVCRNRGAASVTAPPFPYADLDAALAAIAGGGDPGPAATRALAATADQSAVAVPLVAACLKRQLLSSARRVLAAAGAMDEGVRDLLEAKILLAGGAADHAITLLERGAARPDPLWETRHLLPTALHRAGRGSEALAALDALLPEALYPHTVLATKAEWLHEAGMDHEAIAHLDRAIATAPSNRRGRLRQRLAGWLRAAGDEAGARQHEALIAVDDPQWAGR